MAGSASEKRDVPFLEESLKTTLEKVAPPSPIWALQRRDWGMVFYIRVDRGRLYFHTYPHVGGPFQSLQDAQNAIDHFLHDREDPTM